MLARQSYWMQRHAAFDDQSAFGVKATLHAQIVPRRNQRGDFFFAEGVENTPCRRFAKFFVVGRHEHHCAVNRRDDVFHCHAKNYRVVDGANVLIELLSKIEREEASFRAASRHVRNFSQQSVFHQAKFFIVGKIFLRRQIFQDRNELQHLSFFLLAERTELVSVQKPAGEPVNVLERAFLNCRVNRRNHAANRLRQAASAPFRNT